MAISNKKDADIQELVNDVDAFYNEETDPDIEGKVVGITEMLLARRPTQVAIILLTAAAKAVKGSKDSKETVDLGIGDAIGVVIKHKLQDLNSMLEHQCWVEIRAKEKISLDNGNSMWRYALRSRGRRSTFATRQSQTAAPSAPEGRAPGGSADSVESF